MTLLVEPTTRNRPLLKKMIRDKKIAQLLTSGRIGFHDALVSGSAYLHAGPARDPIFRSRSYFLATLELASCLSPAACLELNHLFGRSVWSRTQPVGLWDETVPHLDDQSILCPSPCIPDDSVVSSLTRI
ncbi:hypothetical protein PT974_09510 [Cladobotryum mycophilum]|uniref:Uncharacterized protein n=1 Tax=Cladobotryum mycophilum TaxID=491253 RepID=A0ABR0SHC0_9HYPO